MAKITHGPTVSNARGKIGSTVFTKSRGGNVAKALSVYGGLGDPVTIAHGGTGTATPTPVAGAGISLSATWPNQTITNKWGDTTLSNFPISTGYHLLSYGYKQAAWVPGALDITNGGTGSITGSITGDGPLTFAAGGAHQNVTLTPSGSGTTILNGRVNLFLYGDGGTLQITSPPGGAYSPVLAIREGANPTYGFTFLQDDLTTGDLQLDRLNAGASTQLMTFQRNTGNVGIGTVTPTTKLQVVGLPEHADNAAAIAAGLTAGAFYRTGDLLKVAH